jgi:general secretion pathway protein L
MKTWLYLTATGLNQPSHDWTCCLWQDDQEPQTMSLALAVPALRGSHVELILPMESCSWWLSESWPSRRRPSAQALAYTIEDHLAQELDTLHIATGTADGQQRYPMLVIDRQRLESIVALLTGAGIEPANIYVDADLLPGDQACGAWWFGRWIVGGTLEARLALDDETRQTLNETLPAQMNWLDEPSHLPRVLSANAARAINLRQGPFSLAQRRWPVRSVLAALVATVLIAWAFTLTRSHFLEQESARLYAHSVQRFKSMYPEQTRIVDLGAQLKAQLAREGVSRTTQLALLRRLAEQVIGGSSVEVQRIEYRMGEGWKIQLTANTFAELERLRVRSNQSQLPITLGNASKDQDRVRAVLTLEEGT